jgi:hypothetical protein
MSIEPGQLQSVGKSLPANNVSRTVTAKNYLYYVVDYSQVAAYRFGSRTPHGRVNGETNGSALNVDSSGNVYQVFPTSATSGGFDVMDRQLKSITRSATFSDAFPWAIAVDTKGEEYVTFVTPDKQAKASIKVFSAKASGKVAPVRGISGPRTGLSFPNAIVVDQSGYQYVANFSFSGPVNDILVFAPGAKGDVAPVRIISGEKTGLTRPLNLCLGADGNIYVANQLDSGYDILVFPIKGNGNIAPLWTLQSGVYGSAIALGPGGTMYLSPGSSQQTTPIAVFAPGAKGNDAPTGYLPEDFGTQYPLKMAVSNPWYVL